jgi:hypothetical protein
MGHVRRTTSNLRDSTHHHFVSLRCRRGPGTSRAPSSPSAKSCTRCICCNDTSDELCSARCIVNYTWTLKNVVADRWKSLLARLSDTLLMYLPAKVVGLELDIMVTKMSGLAYPIEHDVICVCVCSSPTEPPSSACEAHNIFILCV